MNTLRIETILAEKYGYSPLQYDLSVKYRKFFIDNIPEFLQLNGSEDELRTTKGSVICAGYLRIVVGDYGAFVEFDSKQANASDFCIQPGQEYRIYDPQYAKNVKYEWHTIRDGSGIKIYKQKRRVSYADYKPRMYYVSVHEVCVLRE